MSNFCGHCTSDSILSDTCVEDSLFLSSILLPITKSISTDRFYLAVTSLWSTKSCNELLLNLQPLLNQQCVVVQKLSVSLTVPKRNSQLHAKWCSIQSSWVHTWEWHKLVLLLTKPPMGCSQSSTQRGRVCIDWMVYLGVSELATKLKKLWTRIEKKNLWACTTTRLIISIVHRVVFRIGIDTETSILILRF